MMIKLICKLKRNEKTNMKVDSKKLLLIMARKAINPYGLCEKAGVCYASYRRAVGGATCKPATLGRLASALGVDVTEIIED